MVATPEALARQKIDVALSEAGWAVQDVSARDSSFQKQRTTPAEVQRAFC